MMKAKHILGLLLAAIALAGCSTKKNTSGSRFYHSFAARFNIMYNGQKAFNEALEDQQRAHQDDYTQLLPVSIARNKTTAGQGKSGFETAIEKSEKAIKLHSIKRKPEVKAGKRLTPKEKEFRNRKEFNPYLRHAWLMIGKSQFQQGLFIEAASTFHYVARMYQTQPEVASVANAWLARCYVAMEWPYDAETILDKTKRDSMTTEGRRERQATQAALYVQTKQYAEAMPPLREAIKHAGNKLQRARLNFLAGQVETLLGHSEEAYKHFQRVIKSNPPYELAFNARIRQSEVTSALSPAKAKSTIKKLQRMARSDKNKDYLDQLYFAIGSIYLNQGDTAHTIGAWETGVEKSTRTGSAKATTLLRLSQLYWERENYIDAARTYSECVSSLDKEHEEYKQSEQRSKMLAEVEPHLSAVKLQDSLQLLVRLPEAKRLEAIDRVIEALKKKEKEEAKKEAAAAQAATTTTNPALPQTPTLPGQKGAWYFYNPQTVSRGAQDFQKKWGKRANHDLWRWSNKEGLDLQKDEEEEGYDYDEPADSIADEDALSDEEQARRDSMANDPHEREYYLAQLPFTEEQMQQSNALLSDGLYNGGLIVMRDIQNFPMAYRMLTRLLTDFPDFDADKRAEALYHQFLLCGRMEKDEEAAEHRAQLLATYPEHERAKLLVNPLYDQIARDGKHLEDTTYVQAWDAYQQSEYAEVDRLYKLHTENFPKGAHRARILFVQAMSQLYSGNRKEFMGLLEELIKSYGEDEVAKMAEDIVKGVKEGRLLSDSKYDYNNIWKRRQFDPLTGDSIQADSLSADRFATFSFVLAYPAGSLDEDQLLFEMARYNFSSYMVRNFEIELMDLNGLSLMCVNGFLSYDEVHAYAQRLYSDQHMHERLQGIRSLIISADNLKKLGVSVSVDDYDDFYQTNFAPLDVPEDLMIDDLKDIPVIDPEEVDTTEEKNESTTQEEEEDDFPWGF